MSNFPLVRYKASDIWIPETDIDGIDANETVLADVANVDFSNGYIENASNVTSTDMPTGVIAKLVTGYLLLSAKTFAHSTQGQQTVYILWKEAADDISDPKLIIYRNDTLLDMDEANVGITYLARPERITYNLANDQLKINLNITANYLIAEPVILNLTLTYLPETKYDNTNERIAGWHICPRWLGWAQKDLAYLYNYYAITEEVNEDFEDGTYITGFSLTTFPGYGSLPFVVGDVRGTEGAMYANNSSPTSYKAYSARISNLRNVKEIEVDYYGVGFGQLAVDGHINYGNIKFYIYDDTATAKNRYTLVGTIDEGLLGDGQSGSITFDLSKITNKTFTIIISASIPPLYDDNVEVATTAAITNLKIRPNKVDVLGLYGDGQRALLFENALSVYGGVEDLRFSMNERIIDWRITKYEIYADISQGYSTLISEVAVDGTGWTKSGFIISKTVSFLDEEERVAMSFKYNLPNDAYVDTQRMIYSEITHKGRIYFVNNDYKVYQSHISTNLAIQADSFPYDEETGFGYFIVDHSKVNLALANSPTNDMVIITNQGLYVYFIQPSGSGSFKQLKMGSGNVSISALKSLTSLLNGEPASDGLFWIDYNGIYFYGGGLTAPENLVTATHQRYWEAISNQDKDEAVGFYNPIRKEYWLYINQEFLIFELSFKKFKNYNTIAGITEFIGYINLVPQYTNGTVILTCTPQSRLSAVIETHYNTIEANPEIYHKILQELYLEFGTSDTAVVQMMVYADNWLVGTYLFDSSKRFDKWLSPVGLRFNRLKLILILPESKHIKIKEFGFSYSPDMAEPLGITPVNIAASGYGFNYGFNY